MSKSRHNKRSGGGLLDYKQRQFCPQPYQDEVFVTLRYLGEVDATATVGVYAYLFRINSPYDPDYTFTGVQPVGFDSWAGIYSKYVVYSCDCCVRATSRTSLGTLNVAMVPTVDNTIVTLEAAYGSRRGAIGTTTGGASPIVLRKNFPIHEVMGVSAAAIDIDDQFSSTTQGSNPTRPCYLQVIVNTSGASDAFSLAVELRMKVKFWLPNLTSTSLTTVRPRQRVDPDSKDLVKASSSIGCEFGSAGVKIPGSTITLGEESDIGRYLRELKELRAEIALMINSNAIPAVPNGARPIQ
jgi:hypothetical protein